MNTVASVVPSVLLFVFVMYDRWCRDREAELRLAVDRESAERAHVLEVERAAIARRELEAAVAQLTVGESVYVDPARDLSDPTDALIPRDMFDPIEDVEDGGTWVGVSAQGVS